MSNHHLHEPEGVLLIDKPGGMTSHDVVDAVRGVLRMKRIGHAGTLDPMATGLLVILVGKATRISQYLMGLDKAYGGTLKLGATTNTHDADGDVLTTRPVPALDEARLEEVMAGFLGDQYQTPPMFSAKKIDGVPLYKLARQGQEVEREPRFIHVSAFQLDEFRAPDELDFTLACSKGTYVRTIAHDLGEKLGCGAHLAALRRLAVGKFSVENSIPLEELEDMAFAEIERALIPVYQAVPSNVL